MNEEPIFDHEKLDVYQIELLFVAWVAALLTEVRSAAPGFHREVCDQLDRASLSSLLNTAEGNGKRQGKQRAKFFDDARLGGMRSLPRCARRQNIGNEGADCEGQSASAAHRWDADEAGRALRRLSSARRRRG